MPQIAHFLPYAVMTLARKFMSRSARVLVIIAYRRALDAFLLISASDTCSGSFSIALRTFRSEGDVPQSWLEVQGEYDNDGVKHAVWIEQIFSNQTADCRVKHWDEVNGIRTIKSIQELNKAISGP